MKNQNKKEIYILKIFGDDQKEIDTFINDLYEDRPLKEFDAEYDFYGDT